MDGTAVSRRNGLWNIPTEMYAGSGESYRNVPYFRSISVQVGAQDEWRGGTGRRSGTTAARSANETRISSARASPSGVCVGEGESARGAAGLQGDSRESDPGLRGRNVQLHLDFLSARSSKDMDWNPPEVSGFTASAFMSRS